MTRTTAISRAGPPPGIVDAWFVPLRSPPFPRERLAMALSLEERAHAARIRVGADSWVAAHGALRLILAHYLEVPPGTLRFERARRGKPRLSLRRGPHFNLSWRRDLALVAVASDRAVGADLERVDAAAEIEGLTRDFISPLESTAIARASPGERRAAFFAAWTRHEARRKLHGLGLEDALPKLAARSLVLVRRLEPPAGYAAAIAAGGGAWRVRMREVTEAL